ncbi:hypothetical protein ACH4U3_34855 [Streptomyces griseoruber]|uniref:hypothetical protein n=1 Tax=Streptomyces griseoruber TaxID=1943 RepID=UPI0037B9C78B
MAAGTGGPAARADPRRLYSVVITPGPVPDDFTENLAEAEACRIRYGRPRSVNPSGSRPHATYTQPYLCGTPATVIERLREFHQAEIGRPDLSFSGPGLPLVSNRRDMELFAAEVLPAERALSDDVVPA